MQKKISKCNFQNPNVAMLHLNTYLCSKFYDVTEIQVSQTLRQIGLKSTPLRIAVLQQLAKKAQALSQPDLETIFEGRENRVTIYRVLRDLEENGLIHRVFDIDGTAHFALCKNSCSEHEHNDEHLHFNCITCKNVFCLDDVVVSVPALPEGFKVQTVKLTVEGICKNCS